MSEFVDDGAALRGARAEALGYDLATLGRLFPGWRDPSRWVPLGGPPRVAVLAGDDLVRVDPWLRRLVRREARRQVRRFLRSLLPAAWERQAALDVCARALGRLRRLGVTVSGDPARTWDYAEPDAVLPPAVRAEARRLQAEALAALGPLLAGGHAPAGA